MGRDFRNASYYRNCWVGKRTIKDGECAVVWNRQGKHRVVKGPYLKRMLFTQIRFMDAHSCSEEEYLSIRFKDGHTEHVNGPASMFANFVTHTSVKALPAIHLASKLECLVVSRQVEPRARPVAAGDDEKGDTSLLLGGLGGEDWAAAGRQRMIVKGPLMFFPKVGDKIEKFPWAGVTPIVRLNSNTHAMEFPVCVNGGGTLGTVSLDVRFKIHDLQLLVDTTPDPLADMTQTMNATVTSLTSSISSSTDPLSPEAFEPLHENKLRELLSTPSNFAAFADWCCGIGVTVALASVTFQHFQPDNMVTFQREQVRREHKAREAAEDKIRKNKEKHEEQLRDASETFEREMAEQRARLEAKRDQLNVEQELAEKKQALELSLLRTRQENELANAKKSNDELVRVVGTIHGIDPAMDLVDILAHISVTGPKKGYTPRKHDNKTEDKKAGET